VEDVYHMVWDGGHMYNRQRAVSERLTAERAPRAVSGRTAGGAEGEEGVT